MAVASLRELTSKNIAARANVLGQAWQDDLNRELGGHPRVGQIRGLGLMIGIEFVTDKKSLAADPGWTSRVVTQCLQMGLIVLSAGVSRNVLTLTPPLTISRRELDDATRLLKEVLYGKSAREEN